MIFTAETGKDSLKNIAVFDRVADVNAIGERFFRVNGSNKVIDIKSILKQESQEKYVKHEKIEIDDILPDFLIDDPSDSFGYKKDLLDLINGETLSVDKKIRVVVDGKMVELHPYLYSKIDTKDAEGTKEQQYYTTENGTFLKKESITPPAFKEMSDDEIGDDVFNAGTIKEYAMVKYLDDDGNAHYLRDAKVQYVFNPDSGKYDAKIRSKVITKDSNGDPVKKEIFEKIEAVATPEVSASAKIKVRSVAITGVEDSYAIYDENKKRVASIEVKQSREIRIHHKVNGSVRDIYITDQKIQIGNFSCPLKSLKVKFEPDGENHYGNLVINIEPLSLENIVFKDGVPVGFKNKDKTKMFDSLPFGIKFTGSIKHSQVDRKISLYKESRIFETVDDKSVMVADVIQTGAVNEKGECLVYDFASRERALAEFQSNIDELKRLSNEGVKTGADLERIKKLKGLVDEQLVKLGDHEAARDIAKKKRILEEEKAKTGADRSQDRIDKAQKEYDDAVINARLGYYKDSEHLAGVDDLIRQYQQGEFFETFYFDESGKKVKITSGELTTITSNLPFDWSKSKAIESILGKDKISIDKRTGKAVVAMDADTVDKAVVSAKIGNLALQLSIGAGPLSLLFMPFGLTIAAGAFAVSGAIALTEKVRTKVKESKINSLTPQKIKDMQDKELEKCIEKEFAKALEQYNEDIQHAERNFTDEADLEQRKLDALNKLTQTRKAVFNQFMLAGAATLTSPSTSKDKKLTTENLYGWAERRRLIKEAKNGKKLDFDTKERLKDLDKKKQLEFEEAKKTISDPKILKKKKAQIDAKYDKMKYDFLSEHGPVKKRLEYLKKTDKYYRATKEERAKMEAECKEFCENYEKTISVETVAVDGKEGPEMDAFRERILKLSKSYLPKVKANETDVDYYDDTEHLLFGDLKVPISVSAEEEHIEKPHEHSEEVEKIEEVIKTYSRTAEQCEEAIADKEKLPDVVDDIYNKQEEVENNMKAVLGEELSKKIMEDESIWFDPSAKKSKIRQLADFVELLDTTYNTPETRTKYLMDKYETVMQAKVKERLISLKAEFKDDKDMADVFKSTSLRLIKDYVVNNYKIESKYGKQEADFYEKFDYLLAKAEKGGKKKKALLDLFKQSKKYEQTKQQEIKDKEIQSKISKAKKWIISTPEYPLFEEERKIILNTESTAEEKLNAIAKVQNAIDLYEKMQAKQSKGKTI